VSSDACEAHADGLPPAFYFAAELGDTALVAAALAGAPSAYISAISSLNLP